MHGTRPDAAATAALAILLAAALIGCGSNGAPSASPGEAVQLLTGAVPAAFARIGGCGLMDYVDGLVIPDSSAGTAIEIDDADGFRTPLMWPPGYGAYQQGAHLALTRPDGSTFATTGNDYRIEGGFAGNLFYACGFVMPE
jgi:hypothetical protein